MDYLSIISELRHIAYIAILDVAAHYYSNVVGHKGDEPRPARSCLVRLEISTWVSAVEAARGDVGGQPGDNNEHCDLRGCASRPIGRFSPPPRTRPRNARRSLWQRVVPPPPPPGRIIHNAHSEITWNRSLSLDITIRWSFCCDLRRVFKSGGEEEARLCSSIIKITISYY